MAELPEPKPGLVIRYAYLWRDEQIRGHEEGRKDRPCAVILAVRQKEGKTRVVVAPFTHSPPDINSGAVEVPPQTAKRLGLDDEAQWIITNEINLFTWPGPDIRPVPGKSPSTIAHGYLPHNLASKIIDNVKEQVAKHSAKSVERDEGLE